MILCIATRVARAARRPAAFQFLPLLILLLAMGVARTEAQTGARPVFTPKGLPPKAGNPRGTGAKVLKPREAGEANLVPIDGPKPKPATGQPIQPVQVGAPAPGAPVIPNPAPAQPKPDSAQPTPFPKLSDRGLFLHYIGRRGGEIEPCGCVKNQLGGVQFEASIYEMSEPTRSVRVDAGGWMPGAASPEGSLKAEYALRAMGDYLALDAVNVGRVDLDLSLSVMDKLRAEHPEVARVLVSTNVYRGDDPEKPAFERYKVVEKEMAGRESVRVAILGVTSAANPGGAPQAAGASGAATYSVRPPEEEVRKALAELEGKADLRVLLAYLPEPELKALATAVPGIDCIVSGAPSGLADGPLPGSDSRVFNVAGSQGKQVGRADLYPREGGGWDVEGVPVTLGVSPKLLKPHAPMIALIEDYKKTTEKLLIKMPAGATRTWAGATMCASCHPNEYRDWRQQLHSKALETLIQKGSQFDANCLKCHTVGFQKDNGFYNVKDQFHLGGVQCENCHGPSLDHAQKENLIRNRTVDGFSPEERERFLAEAKALVPPKEVKAETCVKCHYGDNDPHFDYEKKVQLVNHKLTAALEAPVGLPAAPGQVAPHDPAKGPRTGAGGIRIENRPIPAPGTSPVVPIVIPADPAAAPVAPPVPVPVTAPPPTSGESKDGAEK